MHSYCWQAFYELVQTKERRRPVRYGRHVSFDVGQVSDRSPVLSPTICGKAITTA